MMTIQALNRRKSLKTVGTALFLTALVFLPHVHSAEAASLYFFPNSGTYYSGRTFNVGVYVSSPDVAMNAAQGAVSFPNDKLEVISLSKSDSIMNLWVQEPSFSNRDGIINFGGVVTNPGFKGDFGKILTITFRVNATGKTTLSFLSGSVLANDGSGTNILNSLGNIASLNLTQVPAGGAAAAIPAGIPEPAINSNPPVNAVNWYHIDSIQFNWKIPQGIDGVEYGVSESSDYQFTGISNGLISNISYDLNQFNDGVWYFIARFKQGNDWGHAAIKSFRLDKTPPDAFSITRQDTDFTNSQPEFSWTASDQSSGIAYYQIKIGDGDWFDAKAIQSDSSYILPEQSPAYSRTLRVRAYDNAGNFRESSINFQIVPKTGWRALWYKILIFLNNWGWIFVITTILAVIGLYLLIFRVLKWRSSFKSELREFKNELRRDLKRLEERLEKESEKGMEIDLKPSHLEKAKESLQKEIKHIEEDIKEEIKNIDELNDK